MVGVGVACLCEQSHREFQNDGEISKLDKRDYENILEAVRSVLAAIWLTVKESMKCALNV